MKDRQRKLLELLDKSGASLYALLTRLTLHQDVAEELMQELFIKLSNSNGFYKVANVAAYARTTAINLAFDWRRRQKPAPSGLNQVPKPPLQDNSPLAGLIRKEQLQQILNAISRLKGSCREAFVMRYIQQASYDSIAEQMGRTNHQVRALCHKALTCIRDMVGSGQSQSFEREVYDV